MAVFTAIATAIAGAIGLTGIAATIFTAVASTILTIGASRLLAKRMMNQGDSGGPGGGRIQLPPATDNKIPVIYGSAFLSGPVIDAKLSVDQKFMWYVVAMAEHTDTTADSGMTFDTNNIYYDGKKVNFGFDGRVTGLVNNTTPPQTDTKVNGKIYIYLFPNGSYSGQNTTKSAIQILSDASTGKGIPVSQRWTSTDTMTNCAFAIIRVEYNTDAYTTSLGAIQAKITNYRNKASLLPYRPGDAILDYLQNTRYGAGVPLSRIDTASLDALNTYSDETIDYGTGTQARYRIDGPLNTGTTCLENLQILVDSADSWLQYNELTAKWSVVINQSYTDYTTIDDLFLVDSNNLIGGITLSPINLNETFNQLEVSYPNLHIRDQTDYQLIELEDYASAIMSPNEAINKLDLDFPVINNSVQALYVGVRRLLQSREDLTIACQLDYSGIQLEAGDVIRVKHETYGWDTLNSDKGKLFRVASVSEEKYQDGSLGVKITAFEYNDTVYDDRALLNFVPDPNTGLEDPNIIENIEPPLVIVDEDDSIATVTVTAEVPDTGSITGLDFNWGFDPNSIGHNFFSGIWNADGSPLPYLTTPDLVEIGKHYRINSLGNTSWTSIGATEIDLNTQPALDGFIRPGRRYIIANTGTTDFTVQGAPNNNVGTSFIATGSEFAVGSGKVYETDFYANANIANTTGDIKNIYSVQMSDLAVGNYYWSVTGKRGIVGVRSNATTSSINWSGATVTNTATSARCTANSSGNTITFGTANDSLKLGANVTFDTSNALYTPTGVLGANTYITKIVSNTEIQVTPTPITPLANDCVKFSYLNPRTGQPAGGINASSIYTDTITSLGTLDSLTVSGNVNFYGPNVTLGDVANMHIAGGNNGYFLQTNGNGVISWANGTTTGNGTVGGANRQIQYNNDGNFAGSVGFEFDSDTSNMVVPNWINSGLANNNGYLVGLEYNDVMTDAVPVTSMFVGNTNGFANLVIGNSCNLSNNEFMGSVSNFVVDISSNIFGNATSPYRNVYLWGPGSDYNTVIFPTGGNANLLANVYSNTLYQTGNIGNAGAFATTAYYISGNIANFTWNTSLASIDSSNSDVYFTKGNLTNSNSWSTTALSIGANYKPIRVSSVVNTGPGGPFPVQVISSNSTTNAFTVNTTIDIANQLYGPGDTSLLTVNQKIRTFDTPIGNTAPSTTYYIKNIISNTEVTISETLGGNTFQPTDDTGLDVWSDNNDPVGDTILLVSSDTETPSNQYFYIDATGNISYSGTFTGVDANATANANSISYAPYGYAPYEKSPHFSTRSSVLTSSQFGSFASSRRKSQLGRLGRFTMWNPKFGIYTETIFPTVTPNASSSYAFDVFSPQFSNVFPGYGPNNQVLYWMSCYDEDVANGISNTYMAFYEYPVGGGSPTITTTLNDEVPTYFAPIISGNTANIANTNAYSYTGNFVGIQNQGDASIGNDTKLLFSEDGNNWIVIANNLPNNYATFSTAIEITPFDDYTGNIIIDINGMSSVDPLSSPYVISSNANFQLISASSANTVIIHPRIYAGYQHSNGTNSTSISEGVYKSLGVISANTYMFIRIA